MIYNPLIAYREMRGTGIRSDRTQTVIRGTSTYPFGCRLPSVGFSSWRSNPETRPFWVIQEPRYWTTTPRQTNTAFEHSGRLKVYTDIGLQRAERGRNVDHLRESLVLIGAHR
jgi:hypothetical protein